MQTTPMSLKFCEQTHHLAWISRTDQGEVREEWDEEDEQEYYTEMDLLSSPTVTIKPEDKESFTCMLLWKLVPTSMFL